jgi:hypothetical protein
MARVFLSNETYNAATSGAEVFGAAGTEQVNVFSGTTGVSVASSVERVDLSGNIADYTFSSFGAAMTIRDTAGNIVATVSDSGGKSVVFADGALSAAYAGTTLSLGGVDLTGTAAAITPAAADIDATTTSDAPASTGGTTGGAAQTFTLTASSPSVTEGDTGTKNLTFTLTLDEAPTEATIINYQALTSTTATAGDDFEIAAGIVTFAAGQTVATVSITVNGDTNFEEDETVQVQFSGGALEAAVTATGTITNDDADPAIGSQSFTLTTGPDGFSGTANSDLFIASDATLSSADVLDGAGGSDVLRYASSGTTGTNESGFSTTGIETAQVTADDTGGTTFDVTGMSGLTTIANNNSSANLSFTGLGSIAAVEMESVSGGNTTVTYKDAALSGLADAQTITLNGNANNAGIAASTLSIGDTSGDGLETLNIATTGAASLLADLVTGAATVNVTGDKNLSIGSTGVLLDGATTVNASAFTGNLSVVLDSNGTAKDVTVTGGAGDDTANFSAGFEADDVFTGGEGIDTLGLTNAIATGTPGGSTTDVEQLSISDAGTGTIDMDNFSGVTKVIYDAGITAGATATVDDAASGITVEVDVANATGSLVVDLKTDGSSDTATVVLDDIGAGEGLTLLSVEDAETLTIEADDDTTDGTGTLTIAALTATDATAINLSGDAAVTITGTNDPATPVLATLDASAMTDGLTISGTNFAAGGATIKLGSGNDVFNVATSSGADTFDLTAGGNDRIVYTTLAQSDSGDTDTIKGFTAGSDDIDLRTFVQAIDTSSEFGGTFSSFALAQGALSGGKDNTGVLAVFQADASTLWVDVDDNGTLDAQDFRVVLEGVTKLEASDLALATAGVTFTANTNGFNTATAANSTQNNAVTNENDTINATAAQLAGATIDGLQGTDTLNITSGTAAVDLSGATALTNVETLVDAGGVTTLTLAAADTGTGQLTTITGRANTNQTLAIGANDDLTDVTLRNFTTLTDAGVNAAVNFTLDADNFTDLTAVTLNGGTADTMFLADGTYDFSNIALTFGTAASVLDLGTDGNAAKTVRADAADLNNVGTITGEATAGITTTLAVNDTDDLSGVTVTDVDTITIGTASNTDQTLTVSGADFVAGNFTTVAGSGDDNLAIGDAGAVDFTNTTISGIDALALGTAGANDITLDAASISGTVAVTADAGADLLITETGTYSNLTIESGDFDSLVITDGVTATVGNTTLDDDGTFTSLVAIDSSGAGADGNLVINMTTTTLDLSGVGIGATQDVDTSITGTTGNDTITFADAKAAGSAMTVSGNGGNDQFRLEDASGNVDALVVADAVRITDFGAAGDSVGFAAADLTLAGVQSKASGAVTAATDGFVFINNATVNDFTSLAQFGAAVGALTANAAGQSLAFAIANTAGSQVGIYHFTDSDADTNVGDVAGDVNLVGVIDVTSGSFGIGNINVF